MNLCILTIYFLCVFYVVCNVVVVPVSKMNFCPVHLNRTNQIKCYVINIKLFQKRMLKNNVLEVSFKNT